MADDSNPTPVSSSDGARRAAIEAIWRNSLVIESSVRRGDGPSQYDEVVKALDLIKQAYVDFAADDDKVEKLREALKASLASLVATTSLIVRAEDMKCKPSRAVASDAMFGQMLKDYDKATLKARAALSATATEGENHG